MGDEFSGFKFQVGDVVRVACTYGGEMLVSGRILIEERTVAGLAVQRHYSVVDAQGRRLTFKETELVAAANQSPTKVSAYGPVAAATNPD